MAFCTLVGAAIAVFCVIYWTVSEGFEWEAIPASLLIGVLGFLVALLLSVTATGCYVCANSELSVKKVEETPLIALKDNMATEGHHFLFSGYVDEELTYYYLYEVPGKGITSGDVKAKRAYMNYINEGEQPKLVKTTRGITNPVVSYFLIDALAETVEYSLYIPNDSIIAAHTYEIDLE